MISETACFVKDVTGPRGTLIATTSVCSLALKTGGVAVGDQVDITLDVESIASPA